MGTGRYGRADHCRAAVRRAGLFSPGLRGIAWAKRDNRWCAIDRRGRSVSSIPCAMPIPSLAERPVRVQGRALTAARHCDHRLGAYHYRDNLPRLGNFAGMAITTRRTLNGHQPTFAELFTPKLVTVLREGYRLADFSADVIAGLTVAIVALPLSMAIAIASGVTPDRGLTTAVIGGFIVSLLGGSRFQIGGPAGAFIVLVALTAERHGVDGVILATLMAGVILIAAGYLRLGTYIKFIPYPVTVGFTAGIAVIIFATQIKDLLGITLAKEPGELVPKLQALAGALHTANFSAVAVAAVSIAIIVGLRKLRPSWPGILIAVAVAALAAWALSLPVETIGTRFGGIPQACRGRPGRRSRSRRRGRCCPTRLPSHCSAPSSRCCRRWWPTA